MFKIVKYIQNEKSRQVIVPRNFPWVFFMEMSKNLHNNNNNNNNKLSYSNTLQEYKIITDKKLNQNTPNIKKKKFQHQRTK
jgi:hypothetical protein